MPFVPRRLHLNRNKGQRSNRRLENGLVGVQCLVLGGSIRLATRAASNSDTAKSVNASKPCSYDESKDSSCLCTGSVDDIVATVGPVSAGILRSGVKGTAVGVSDVWVGRDSSDQSKRIASSIICSWYAKGRWFASLPTGVRASKGVWACCHRSDVSSSTCNGLASSVAGSSRLMNWSRESRQNWSKASSSPMRNGCQDKDSCVTGRSGSLGSFGSSASPFSPSPVPACSDRLCPTVTVLTGRNETAAAASPSNAPGLSSAVEVSIVRVSRVAIRGSAASRRGCNPSWNVKSVANSLPSVAA